MGSNECLVIAHRGLAATYPENTLKGIEAALQLNIDFLEIDVHKTKDNELVVIHDDTIDRTSNGSGRIQDYTLAELKKYDFGSWKGEEFAGLTIPTLTEVLDMVVQYNQKLLIEVKKPKQYPGIEDLLISMLTEHKIATEDVVIQSFDKKSMKYIASLTIGHQLGVLLSRKRYWYQKPDFKALAEYATLANPDFKLATAEFVQQAHEHKLLVAPYTVNDLTTKDQLLTAGVDGIISDAPNMLFNIE
ncbi:glycerophosphodiester phosphodiesterase [Staphylococcus arlettae]|uniref:glycerophosphodiester phosphodiesterase n=1 Tax=Staphylococcus arlettae TaxID=29378 RepID=UPI000E67A298|nr:glycerophosphodiester phosphodiesterase family protein [Staphylococcus arlettae]RIM76687.1 glycerophosphodiester phosphodiesterase [Staphylococcus arlettae]